MYSDNKQIRDVADVAARIMAGLPPIEEELKGGQVKLDKNHNGKIDGQDFKILKGQKKANEEVEEKEESHQSKTTMKHIPNASPALKQAAKDIKPGVGGYRDRIDMLKAGGVKEEVELDEDELGKKKKEQVVTVKHKDSGKELRVVKPAVADYQKRGYHPVKEEIEQMDEVKMADLPSTKVQGRSYGASKPQPSAFDVLKGPKDKELTAIDAEKKKKKISEMIAIYKEGGLKTFFESIKKEDLIIEEPDSEQFAKDLEDAKKRAAGTKPQADVAKASVQAVKQEAVEELDELSKGTLNSYMDKAKDRYIKHASSTSTFSPSANKKSVKYAKNMLKAKEKGGKFSEAVEQDIEVLDADLVNGFAEVNIEERTLTAAETDKKEHIVKSMKKGMAGFKERYGDRAKSVMYATATKQAKKD